MSRCDDLREQLDAVALGDAASPELATHLAECADCTSVLQRQCALAARLDEAVRSIVRVEPPPLLVAGVATRLARGERVWDWSALGPRLTASLAAAVCVALLVLGLRAFERPTPPHASELSALAAWRSPTLSLLEPRGLSLDIRPSPSRTSGGTRGS